MASRLQLRVAGALDELHRASAYQGDDDLVFGQPLHRRTIGSGAGLKRSKRYCETAGVRKKVRFHDLRHAFGTRMAAAGVPLRTLQEWMGHAVLEDDADLRRLLARGQRGGDR